MKTQICLFIFVILLLPKNLLSQETENKESTTFKRNQLGFQLNPFINDMLLRSGGLSYIQIVSSVRYGYRITKNITTGIEFSCGFPINRNTDYFNYFGYKTGVYFRYLYPAHSRFQVFAEASPYYSHIWREFTSTGNPAPYRTDKFGYYVAPGISLYTKNKKVSFDLYYKFSNLRFANGNMSVFSYKVNYNF